MTTKSPAYLRRQSVFNARGSIIAYNLLCHSHDSAAPVCKGYYDYAGIEKIVGKHAAFIPVDADLLFSDFVSALPPERYTLSLSCDIDINETTVGRITELYESGFRFALDNLRADPAALAAFSVLFPYITWVKINVADSDESNLLHTLSRLKPYSFTFVAKRIEDPKQFERFKSYGFTLFEGCFFEKPVVVEGIRLEPLTLKVFELIELLQRDVPVAETEKVFKSAPDLMFNLLRYLNSAAFTFRSEITGIRHALNLLGSQRLLSWLGLFLYARKEEKPFGTALFKASLFRGKVMEELAVRMGYPQEKESAFLTGTLSLIDVYFQIPITEILDNVRLDLSIRDALLTQSGFLGELLSIAKTLESSERTLCITQIADTLRLDPGVLFTILSDAYAFADNSCDVL